MLELEERVAGALGERYLVERELGRGGMATVFLARDQKHGRHVALKVLRPEVSASLGVERFLREIRLSAQLHHPHVVPLYDSGRAGELLFYVMPYIEGESLRERLTREGRLALGDALRVARDVADALDYAHRHAIVHRDIKPENIMLADDHALVTDFGIARAIDAAGGEAQATLTGVGSVAGTPMYMSPEQVSGETALDGRSDIYSLGCVLFEMLAGVPPFVGKSVNTVLVARLLDSPPPLRSVVPTIPAAVEAVIERALGLYPADRFATAAGLSRALEEASRGGGPGSSRPDEEPRLPKRPRTPEASVAVLPFVNLSGDPANEYLGDGITEELINALARVRGLRVAARSSTFAYKGREQDARVLGERLKVRALVEGSVRRQGDRLRIAAQLIDAADGYHLWSETYDRRIEDVFAVQDEIARTLANTLSPQLVSGGSSLIRPSTEVVEAYTLYLRGRYLLTQRTADAFLSAIGCFQQAVDLDPGYAGAHAGIAHAYCMLGFDEYCAMAPTEAMPKAKAAAARALELDDRLGEAHARLALITMMYDWDWARAEHEFQQALVLNPHDGAAYHWYSLFLSSMGRHDESLDLITRALGLEPYTVYLNVQLGRAHLYARRFPEAIRQLRAMMELVRHGSGMTEPGSVYNAVELARVYLAQNTPDMARELVEGAMGQVGRQPILLMLAGQAYAALGKPDAARELLAELRRLTLRRYIPPLYEASLLAALNDLTDAFAMLDRACEERSGWLVFMRVAPQWDPLRSDPRFLTILKRIGLDF
jgi:eukaryotic-like serine/threonine-protein kinase